MAHHLVSILASLTATTLVAFLSFVAADPLPKPTLNGLTVLSAPFMAQESDGQLHGFADDLLAEIANKVAFTYVLKVQPDGKYGQLVGGKFNGMIAEVEAKRVDFALADLTITEERRTVVDFTEPFLSNQLAALVRKDQVEGLNSLEDLVKKNEIAAKSTPPRKAVIFGAIKSGATLRKLSQTNDTIGRAVYTSVAANSDAQVPSMKVGIEKATAGFFAFVTETSAAEYIAAHNCDLTSLADTRNISSQNYAIALPKGSPYLAAFDKAIKELKADGTIDRLKSRHWAKNC